MKSNKPNKPSNHNSTNMSNETSITNSDRNFHLIIIVLLTSTLLITGGMPITNIVYPIIEKIYGVQMPTYNINKNLALVSEYKESKQKKEDMKVEVSSSTQLQRIMNSKQVYLTQIPTTDSSTIKFRVEGYMTIKDYFRVLESISVKGITLKNTLLNEEELIITIQK